MTDIDFDELDRAVSSVMGTKSATKSAKKDAPAEEPAVEKSEASTSDTTLDLTSVKMPDVPEKAEKVEAPAVEETPKVDTHPEAEEAAAANDEPASQTIVAKKRGQFMDVMHPSADMTTRPTPVAVSRTNVVLQPSAKFAKSLEGIRPPEPAVADKIEAAPEPDTVLRSNDWPDPVDLAPSPDVAVSPDVEASTTPEPAAPDTTEPVEQAPQVSPFLPDAKVEKRPLGSAAPTTIPEEPEEEPVDSATEAGEDTPPDSVTPMPEELSSDILSVESGAMANPLPAPTPVQPIDESSDDTRTSGPSSISPQYKTSELTDEDLSGTLYDAGSHQQLTQPAKRSSGWLVVLIIIVILALGAGGGYLAYTYGLFR